MSKRKEPTKKVPVRLARAQTPAIDKPDDLKLSTEMLRKQRINLDSDYEYALLTTTMSFELEDVKDEFTREFKFSEQAKEAASKVLPKLKDLGIPTEVPKTYRGEMVKDERQMARVRDTLKSKKNSIEKSEKMKKLRELKKMGKKIQQEVLKKRSRDKKEFLEQVKKKPVSDLFETE